MWKWENDFNLILSNSKSFLLRKRSISYDSLNQISRISRIMRIYFKDDAELMTLSWWRWLMAQISRDFRAVDATLKWTAFREQRTYQNKTWFYQNLREEERTKLDFTKTQETERERNLVLIKLKRRRENETWF